MPQPAEHKAVAEEFDRYRDTYSEAVNDALVVPGMGVDYFTRIKAGYISDLAGSRFGATQDLSALDLGCGIGNYHDLLAATFGRLTGVDVSSECIERARATHPNVSYKSYEGGTLPFADDAFDVAFAICVVHHVPVDSRDEFFGEMHRVLKPGGLGLILEHNPSNPLTMRVVNRCPFDRDAVLLKPKTTIGLMVESGFGEVASRTIISIPTLGGATRRLDWTLGRMPFGAQYIVKGSKRAPA